MAHQISHKNRCIFVHVPKAGGTSVECSAIFDDQRARTGDHVGGHFTALEYRATYPDEFRDYFTFAFVRNPYDRLVSAFLYLNRGGTTPGDRRVFEVHLKRYQGDFEAFCEGLHDHESVRSILHLRPQVDFVCDENGELIVDYVGRLEQMAADFAVVTKRLGEQVRLPRKNRSTQMGYYRFYRSARVREIVTGVYESDFSALGYPLQPAGQRLRPTIHRIRGASARLARSWIPRRGRY